MEYNSLNIEVNNPFADEQLLHTTLPGLLDHSYNKDISSLPQAPKTYTMVFRKTFGTLDSGIEVAH